MSSQGETGVFLGVMDIMIKLPKNMKGHRSLTARETGTVELMSQEVVSNLFINT